MRTNLKLILGATEPESGLDLSDFNIYTPSQDLWL